MLDGSTLLTRLNAALSGHTSFTTQATGPSTNSSDSGRTPNERDNPPRSSPSPSPQGTSTALAPSSSLSSSANTNTLHARSPLTQSSMAPLSPRSSTYERLEVGMGPPSPHPHGSKRRFGWKKFAIGAAALIGVVYLFGPREARLGWSAGAGKEKGKAGAAVPHYPLTPATDPLPGPPETTHLDQARPPLPSPPSLPASSPHPTSPATDPDLLKTTHCTTPHPSAPNGRLVTYALMLDAGSTGSRIHIYKFHHCSSSPAFEYEVFKMTQPGLSSFAGDPEGAAGSLDVLMDEAVKVVPKDLWGCTPVAVKATAGLRLLPGSQSKDILEAVEARLHAAYPFHVVEKDGVVVMDGKDEGVYAWITANYLLGTISSSSASQSSGTSNSTYAVLDLGGASTQIVFEPLFPASSPSTLEDGEHKYTLAFSGASHELYQHSYLGYGLKRARSHVHSLIAFMHTIRPSETPSTSKDIVPNPCLARGTRKVVPVGNGEDRDGDGEVDTVEVTMDGGEVGGFEACERVVGLVLAKDAICELKPCSFNGVYQPSLLDAFPAGTGKVLLLSYFYDRIFPLLPLPASISPSPSPPPSSSPTTEPPLNVSTLASLARLVCAGHPAWLAAYGTNTALMKELQERPEWCLDLTFMHSLLRLGYEFEDTREVELGKRVRGTELGWCLGATIAIVGGDLKCRA